MSCEAKSCVFLINKHTIKMWFSPDSDEICKDQAQFTSERATALHSLAPTLIKHTIKMWFSPDSDEICIDHAQFTSERATALHSLAPTLIKHT